MAKQSGVWKGLRIEGIQLDKSLLFQQPPKQKESRFKLREEGCAMRFRVCFA